MAAKKKKKKPHIHLKPTKREPAEFLHNPEWTTVFGQEDDDQPKPIYGVMKHDAAAK